MEKNSTIVVSILKDFIPINEGLALKFHSHTSILALKPTMLPTIEGKQLHIHGNGFKNRSEPYVCIFTWIDKNISLSVASKAVVIDQYFFALDNVIPNFGLHQRGTSVNFFGSNFIDNTLFRCNFILGEAHLAVHTTFISERNIFLSITVYFK